MLDWISYLQKSYPSMFKSQKRKSPWSRSFFGSKPLNKIFILEDSQNAGDGTKSYEFIRETSLNGLNNAATRPKPSPLAKLRRSGSKVRSILSKRQSNGIFSSTMLSAPTNKEQTVEPEAASPAR